MKVVVDTSIWSLAFRRHPRSLRVEEQKNENELSNLVRQRRAELAGPVRQELLSGIRDPSQYERLREKLRAFPDTHLAPEDYEEAARASNLCGAKGIAGSAIDFLICAVALRRGWSVFTVDKDFERYHTCVPFRLHVAGS